MSEHPGKLLRRTFARRAITQDDIAKRIGVSRFTVNQILNERRAVTARTALLLERHYGFNPEALLRMQIRFDLADARHRLADEGLL